MHAKPIFVLSLFLSVSVPATAAAAVPTRLIAIPSQALSVTTAECSTRVEHRAAKGWFSYNSQPERFYLDLKWGAKPQVGGTGLSEASWLSSSCWCCKEKDTAAQASNQQEPASQQAVRGQGHQLGQQQAEVEGHRPQSGWQAANRQALPVKGRDTKEARDLAKKRFTSSL